MLLNILAKRTSIGIVRDSGFVNGQAQTRYCQQTDTHEPTPSIRKEILFSAILRQPQNVPVAEKEACVEKCLLMCGLEKYVDAIVGTLCGEQRKRSPIAVELAAKPKLPLFSPGALDEPTSGLNPQALGVS